MKSCLFLLTVLSLCVSGCLSPAGNDKVSVCQMKALKEYPCQELVASLFPLKDSLFRPENIWVVDSLLVLQDGGYRYLGHDFLRVYSLKNGELMSSFGRIGRGPGEFLLPRFFWNGDRSFLIIEKLKYYLFDLDSLLKNKNYQPAGFEVKDWLKGTNFACLYRDSVLVFNTASGEQLMMVSPGSDSVCRYRNYPEWAAVPGITDFMANTKVYQGCYGVHPETKDRVNIAYRYFPAVDIVSLNSLETRRIVFSIDRSVNHFRKIDDLNAEITEPCIYYREVFNTKHFMWLLYNGIPRSEHREEGQYPEIHQFDWEGQLVRRYRADRIIKAFCVDEREEHIYALSLDEKYEPVTVCYDLPE